MKYSLSILALLLMAVTAVAQPDSLYFKNNQNLPIEIKPEWSLKNNAGLDLSEVAFVNWNAGGTNSISALAKLNAELFYRDKNKTWRSNGAFRYGINNQEGKKLRKTEDVIELGSSFGYRKDTLTNWFYSARMNFKTQLSNGYKYPNRDNPISQFMAPGYLFFGGGAEWGKHIEKFNLYLSPLTFKSTFVLDEDLANKGSFGVTSAVIDESGNIIVPGKRTRTEMGILVTNAYETLVGENISMRHAVSLYTDYLNSFGNVDLDWEMVFDFKVNNYVRASFGSHFRYDNDVKTFEETEVEGELKERGAKLQWKQHLGVGFVVDF